MSNVKVVMPKSINNLVALAHQNAIDKGFHEEPRTFGESIALIMSELAEAFEDYRNGKGFTEVWYEYKDSNGKTYRNNAPSEFDYEGKEIFGKPCGIPSEFADAVIRIFDTVGDLGIDLEAAIEEKMRYNATRPRKHGGKVL